MDKLPGVWVGEETREKVAAMGVRIAGGVTMHGFALNVNVDLEAFRRIVPCGITGCRATSMEAVLGKPVDVSMVRRRIAEVFAQVFGLVWTHWVPCRIAESAPVGTERIANSSRGLVEQPTATRG